ncbi:cation diffusion facilitator family transporter [Alloscardovia venturai]|uniref:Cation diffusion facilitator family transporter n=1 Tax=Alloscardovia venturai TaxID=1769421 RepID=A0ABW2Y473_9BIFI
MSISADVTSSVSEKQNVTNLNPANEKQSASLVEESELNARNIVKATEKNEHGGSSVIAALIVNFLVFLFKLIAALIGKSSALLAESVHSFSDCGNEAMLIFGKWFSQRSDPDERHPQGWANFRNVSSLIVALLLFFVGGLYSVMNSAAKIEEIIAHGGFSPLDDTGFWLGAAAIVFALIVEGISLSVSFKEARAQMKLEGLEGLTMFQFWKKTKAAELATVMTEDSLAIAGLIIAGIGLLIARITGNELYDAIGGAADGAFIAIGGIALAVKIASMLNEEAPHRHIIEKMLNIVATYPGVKSVISYEITHKSEDFIHPSFKVEVDKVLQDASDNDFFIEDVINGIEKKLYEAFPQYTLQIWVEPDHRRGLDRVPNQGHLEPANYEE